MAVMVVPGMDPSESEDESGLEGVDGVLPRCKNRHESVPTAAIPLGMLLLSSATS